MELETVVNQNVNDIKNLATQVTRLATIVETTEKQRASDNDSIKDVAKGMTTLNEKIGQALSMSKDIAALRDILSERAEDIGGLRHDIKNTMQALQVIPMIKEKLSEVDKVVSVLTNRMESVEKILNKAEGASKAVETMAVVFWAIFGSAIGGLVCWVAKTFLSAGGHADIGGE